MLKASLSLVRGPKEEVFGVADEQLRVSDGCKLAALCSA